MQTDDASVNAKDIENERGTWAHLYPQLSERQRREAIANLQRYFAIVFTEEHTRRANGLTQAEPLPTMKERSIDDLKI